MRDIDQLNRDSQTARVALEAAGVEVAEAHGALTAASLAANTERIRAEGAADRCQAARRQLAECVEGSAGAEPADEADRPQLSAAPRSPADDRSRSPGRELVIERL